MRITFHGDPTAIAPQDIVVAFRLHSQAKRPPNHDPTRIPAFFRVLRRHRGDNLPLTFGIADIPATDNDPGRSERIFIDIPFELAASRFNLIPTRDPVLAKRILEKAWGIRLAWIESAIPVPDYAEILATWSVA